MMDFLNMFKDFKIDSWYKLFVYLGCVVFIFSLFIETKGISNHSAQLLSAGLFLIGIGEWKNHKVAAWVKNANAFTGPAALVQAPIRDADFIGVLLDILGFVLIILSLLSIFKII